MAAVVAGRTGPTTRHARTLQLRFARMDHAVAAYLQQLDRVPGWFDREDFAIFDWILGWQEDHEPEGDLAELGVYLGRSAILVGLHRRPDETFTVCDLFEGPARDPANAAENTAEYPRLTRQAFEANYLRFLGELPVVVTGPTASLLGVVPAGRFRFVHVDASHLWEHVVGDLALAAVMLRNGGIVVVDDYRSAHTPGVAAAAWAAVVDGLRPIALTASKLYATWGDPTPLRATLTAHVAAAGWQYETQHLIGTDVLRVARLPQALDRRERLERAILPGAVKWRLDQRRRRLARLVS